MMGRGRAGVVLGVWCAVWLAASAARGAPGPAAVGALDRPAFTATAAELLALAKAAPAGDDVMLVLRDERDVRYDDQGRATVRERRVYVVEVEGGDDDDDEGDGGVEAGWAPSHQDRPVIRARVISPGGAVAELDPALVVEAPRAPRAGSLGDHRSVVARLPPRVAGAVVEQEIVTADREPTGPAGRLDLAMIGSAGRTLSTVITYSAPVALRLHHVERLLPAGARVRHEVGNGRERWTCELPAATAPRAFEAEQPADAVAWPYVGASTGASWEAVARAFRKQLDQRMAEGPVALAAELPRAATVEAVAAIVAWAHRAVKSSRAAIGGDARLPLPPARVVAAATGDDHDKATLLVALLRQAGIRAEVVLVASAWRASADPELPSASAFDRAVVRARLGARELWIDPADELARPGQLSARDQGRRALVIADDTKQLSMTPAAAPADNLIREVRTFVPAESGPSQVTRVVRYAGVFEAEQRSWARGVRPDALAKRLAGRSEEMFGGTLARATTSDAEDLAQPFELTVAVKDARRVVAGAELLDIILYPSATFERLPWVVTSEPDKARTSDFAWRLPHVYEVEHRIVVPPGFTLPTLDPERVLRVGTASFTERRQLDGRTLIVTFRLDTGKARLTAGELATLRGGLRELGEEVVRIKLEQTAVALDTAGKPREAIAECERLIALHPGEALHHDQLATVLVHAGAGEAARREARRGVALQPTDVDALTALGWTLSFDTLGRMYTYDWDRAGAIAVLQRARKLAADHLGAAVTLARALERGPTGQLYDETDLAGAVAVWRAAYALANTDENAQAFAQALVWSGGHAEAEKVLRKAASSELRDSWLVTAIAAARGATAATKAAGDLRSGAERSKLLAKAGWMAMFLQHHDAARELLAEGGVLAGAPAAVTSMVSKARRAPPIKLGTADPRAAVFDAFFAELEPLHKTPVFWDAAVARAVRATGPRLGPTVMQIALSSRWVEDVVQSMVSVEVEGEAGLWHAKVEYGGQRAQLYLVLDHGVAKVLGATMVVAGVGRYILQDRDPRADARARKLLDWVRADHDQATEPTLVLFKRLWGPGMPTAHDAIRLAAAALSAGTDPDREIAAASRCGSTLPDAELACHEVLYLAHRERGNWSEAVAHSEAILALQPSALGARVRSHAWVLARAGQFDDADRALAEVLAKDPDAQAARIGRFEVAAIRGARADLAQRADALVNHPAASPWDLNYVAWSRLAPGGDLPGALELARRAVARRPNDDSALNTLAAIEAELGELGDAIRDNHKALELNHAFEPDAGDWYVSGRIAEQLGLAADATACYRRVTKPAHDTLLSPYELAQHRLAAMGIAR